MISNKQIITLLLFFLVNACTPKENIPPNIPGTESVYFDFDFFSINKNENINYTHASEKVLSWKDNLEDSVSIHNTILSEAVYNEFIFQKEHTWMMDFSFINDEKRYDSKVFGIINVDTVVYNAFLTFDSDTNIMFINGKSFNNYKNGEWQFNKPIEDSIYTYIKILTVNWNVDSLNRKELKFTNNQSGENNLNYILYKDTTSFLHDSYIDIYNKGAENHSIIEWNNLTKIGRVKDVNKFGDENWHCWNENYQDIDCNN